VKPRSDGTTLIALYHFLSGFISLVGICGTLSLPLLVGLAARTGGSPDDAAAALIVTVVALLIGGLLLLITVANWVVGWGLWQGREWARVAALALAILRLFNVPLGTLIGGLIIWYLLREEVKAEFTR